MKKERQEELPAKERKMSKKEYTQEDFEDMSVRAGALKDFAETLTYLDSNADMPLTSIALILTELIDPIIHFLSWAYTYAEIPEGKGEADE